jgi:DNA invertase Pin-like site-specific DNA recombinase
LIHNVVDLRCLNIARRIWPRGTLERPALKRLMADIEGRRVDVVVVYKIDRLSRSLMDFTRLVEVFDRNAVTFVSVTQSFNTTTSMGRLTLNILLSFAQFERELTGERIRDIRGVPEEGHVDGWLGPPRVRHPGSQALHQRRGSGPCAVRFRAIRAAISSSRVLSMPAP